MIKRRTHRPAVVLALGLLLVAATTAWTVSRSEQPLSALERKFAEAERLRCYILSRAAPAPEFLLSGREQRLRLITHAVLPGREPYDAERETVYGIRFVLQSAEGELLWQRDVYTKSRQSKHERAAFGFRYENSFMAGFDYELSDDRVLEIDLPRVLPRRSRLRLERLGAPAEVVFRMYNREPQQQLGGPPPALAMAPMDRDHAALDRTDLPWDRLLADEHDELLRYKWERMGAEGEEGEHFATRIIFYTGLRIPRKGATLLEGSPFWPAHDLAFNVRGPATFSVTASVEPEALRPKVAQFVEVERRSAEGALAVSRLRLPTEQLRATSRIDVPAGIHTLILRAVGDSALRATMLVQPGSAPQINPDLPPVFEQEAAVIPDVKRIRVIAVDQSDIPALVEFDAEADAAARTLRIDVRVPIAPGRASSGDFSVALSGTTTLSLVMRGADGQVIRTEALPITAPRSRFEQVLGPDGTASDVTEPWPVRLIVPTGVVQLELHADRLAYLRLSALTTEPNELDLPYRELESTLMSFRYATLVRRTFWPFQPSNYPLLTEKARVGTLIAQVRLEPVGQEEPVREDLATRSLQPLGHAESHATLERVPAEKVNAALRSWESGGYTELKAGLATPVVFGRTTSARASLMFWVVPGAEARSLGQSVAVRVDGHVVHELALRETRGAFSLPPVAAGRHQLEVVTQAQGVRWYTNQPPAAPTAAAYRKHTLFDLRPGRTLRLLSARRADATSAFYMIAYAHTREALPEPQFRVRIDGGQPKRVEGKLVQSLTRADRTALLRQPYAEEPAMFIDLRGAETGYPRQLRLGFGDDIPEGPHRVEVTNIGREVVWARFFETGVARRDRERVVQGSTTLEKTGAGE